MRIKLKNLKLSNFKGIRSLEIEFRDITCIYGKNESGKTTTFDAFLWLLFGKDSTGRKDFEIKTLGADNEPFHKLDHEVSAVIDVDGDQVQIKRTLREKWVTKRGEPKPVFNGHETVFFWDDVPLKLNEWETKIYGIMKEDVFKLITNPGYFNQLKWQDRRTVLESIAGIQSDRDALQSLIAGGKTEFQRLLDALTGTKTVDEYKRTITAKKKTIADELGKMPSRIDEATRSLPVPWDYDAAQILLDSKLERLAIVEKLLMDKTSAMNEQQNVITAKMRELQTLKSNRITIENNIRNSVRDRRQTREQKIIDDQRLFESVNNEINRLIIEIGNEQTRLTNYNRMRNELRTDWERVNGQTLTFNDAEFKCPACERPLDAVNIEDKKKTLTEKFNADKARQLNDINTRGNTLRIDCETIETTIANKTETGKQKRAELEIISNRISQGQEENTRLNNDEQTQIMNDIAANADIKSIDEQIRAIDDELNAPKRDDDNTPLLDEKRELQSAINVQRDVLANREQHDRITKRINELQTMESDMAAELASYEGIEFMVEQFTKCKMDELETRVNSQFNYVRFKMFEKQINGGMAECCETLINGVPYSDANTASRINAGLDIINTLSAFYDAYAPVFVDNAESVNELMKINSQLVPLVVSTDPKLRIEYSAK